MSKLKLYKLMGSNAYTADWYKELKSANTPHI